MLDPPPRLQPCLSAPQLGPSRPLTPRCWRSKCRCRLGEQGQEGFLARNGPREPLLRAGQGRTGHRHAGGGGHRHPPCTQTKSSWSAMKETGCFGGGEAGKTTAGCSTGWGEPLGTPLPSTTFTMPARSPSGDAVPPDLGTNIAGTGTVRGGWRAGRRGPPAHTKRLQPRSPRPPLPMPRGCCSLTPCAGEAGAC